MSRRSASGPWGTLTPDYVGNLMNFSKSQRTWIYQQDRTMECRQAEGVAHLWNVLGTECLALLADEVGMGKTFQALAAVQYAQSIGVKKKTLFAAVPRASGDEPRRRQNHRGRQHCSPRQRG